jgi:hypothetical protein
MSNPSTNPLAKHFRQPGIYLTLPSSGHYWPDGTLELTMNNQIAVYPMTTRDEITIRTPDALLNGQSVVDIIQSCCPQIKDAWQCPSVDIDSILVAIRIASYGQNMDVDTVCPNQECKHENRHSLDLTGVLDSIGQPNFDRTLDINNLKIKLRPASYQNSTKTNIANFEEQRILQLVQNENIPDDEKMKQFNSHLQKMVGINLDIIASATEYIETEDGTRVKDQTFIRDFYDNCDNKIIKAIRDRFDQAMKMVALPQPKVRCEECNTDYPVEIKFDYANFFESAS